MFGYSAASFGNSYAATEGANANGSVGAGGLASLRGGAGGDPYAWAQRLRDIPDEDVLAELSMMGFTDASMQSRRGGGGGERARAGHSNNGVKRVAGAGAASRCWSHVHAAFPTPHLAQPSPPCSLHALSMLSPCSHPACCACRREGLQLCQRHRQQQEEAAQLCGPRHQPPSPPLISCFAAGLRSQPLTTGGAALPLRLPSLWMMRVAGSWQ